MLDIKRIREDFEGVKERVAFRGKGDFGIDNVKKYVESVDWNERIQEWT